jgi:hypothetical protein
MIAVLVVSVMVCAGCIGPSKIVTSDKEITLKKPLNYDHAFDAGMKSAIDMGFSTEESDKSLGLIKAKKLAPGVRGYTGVEVYFDRDGDIVKDIRIKAGGGGGMFIHPYSKSEADELLQEYITTINKYLY